MKKILTMLLAFTMMITMAMPAFAASENCSIVINSVSEGAVYQIYKLLDLESYNTVSGAYAYEVNSAWRDFFATSEAKKYYTVGDSGYVTWTWVAPTESDNTENDELAVHQPTTPEEAAAQFAKLALAYAKSRNEDQNDNNNIPIIRSSNITGQFTINEDDGSGTFSNLEKGYYLVDSNVGALCALTTTNPVAVVNTKNGTPTIDKQVLEDSTNQWGAMNTADIGQIVEYRVTITVHAGAQKYTLHDSMESGLTFEQESHENAEGTDEYILPNATLSGTEDANLLLYPENVDATMKKAYRGVWRIEHVVPSVNGGTSKVTPIPASAYSLENITGRGFDIKFTDAFCDHLNTNDKIIIHYNAMLNRYADIADNNTGVDNGVTDKGAGNVNEAWLSYGETFNTTVDQVTTKTYGADIVKTGKQNMLLDGAKFKVYDAAHGGSEIEFVILEAEECTCENHTDALETSGDVYLTYDFNDDGVDEYFHEIKKYRRAREDETGVEIIVNNGKVRLVGLDNGTYYLYETEAPAGYNELSARHPFTISDGNLDAIFSGENNIYSTGSGIHVQNMTGDMLPETGGAGTVMFITCGMIVVLGAGVLLVTKKRMNMIK